MEQAVQSPTVFLSYASPDRARVLEFYQYLTAAGFDVWLDIKRLKAGQNWDFEVRRALDRAAVVVVFISKNSVDKRGYVQREIKISLKKLEEKLIEDIYIVPVRIDEDATIPAELSQIHVVTGDGDSSKQDVVDAIRHAIDEQGVQIANAQENSNISWILHRYSDEWDGLPGYSLIFDWFILRSQLYPNISEIGEIVKGILLTDASEWRTVKFDQNPDFHNFGESKSQRQNSWEATCASPITHGRVISFQYSIWWYGAKAAHPNFGFKTFNFLLDPISPISLRNIFQDEDNALRILKEEIRASLTGPSGQKDPEYPLDIEWVQRGTNSWEDIDAFTFGDQEISFYFGAYAVAPYAWGPQFASVPYKKVASLIKPEFRSALDIYYSEQLEKNWMEELAPDVGNSES